MICLLAGTKQFKEKKVYLRSLWARSFIAEKTWRQGLEGSGPIAVSVRKQRWMLTLG